MDILGDRKYVNIPGDRTHELPPLLLRAGPDARRMEGVLEMAAGIIQTEELIPDAPSESYESDWERRRMDLSLHLAEEYMHFISHWRWGDSVLEWIRQCEFTFETRPELRNLLRPDIWPHAGRTSFVKLLEDKSAGGVVDLERAVGLRLTFRQPPPISFFSNQFLFYLKSSVAATAYQKWAELSPAPIADLPPERFSFDVVDINVG